MSIAVFGSINIDLTTYAKRLPAPGETLHGDTYGLGLGGKGCNQAVACVKLGAQTAMIGRIGPDMFGETALKALTELNVPTDHIYSDPDNKTGIAVIGVDEKAENCITVIGGANMAIDESDVVRSQAVFKASDILLLQLEIPMQAGLKAAALVREAGGRVIFDPAPAPAEGLADAVLSQIDIITPNETETGLLTGLRPSNRAEAAEAATRLRARGVPVAIIKLGAHGVYFQSATEEGFVEPFKVEAIDTVAAGDCFNGGLAYALADGLSLSDAVRFAAACGALSTTKRGASSAAPTLAEVTAMLNA
ncbi:ribokinase [Cohaesibacter sp. CAU 1516]|uniref:ribokinase n=1 Tax=Cohaesibacter sp. CAU 1516 TaxID=2576038 RepID=UPI0010FF1ED4|nr:ribokinase [Cohaesibacter sp. CAU 1516]TLP46159.1 ribokinase [Cohaesibacter sp. CAU 1516]